MDASAKPIAEPLLAWYDAHHRQLPWRSPPGKPPPDPYRVWLSEIMLQQTTVAAVIPYFAAFTARWPTVAALAAAEEADVLAAWAGLGYYARARNLIACAKVVTAGGGQFPASEAELRRLPGLGAYSAAAVAAIAFGARAAVVDANVERVVARLYALAVPLPQARRTIRDLTDRMTPADRPGDFAQAMMDLGAGVCTVRTPRCGLCPLAAQCDAREGDPAAFPVKPAKKARGQRRGRAFWIARGNDVWLVRRPPHGILGGMRALPDDGWNAAADGAGAAPLPGKWHPGGTVRHTFSHFDLDLQLMLYSGEAWARLAEQPGEWWPRDALDQAGLPTLFRKAAMLATATEQTGENC